MPRWIGILAPGAPQLLGGKALEGGGALMLWVGLLALAVARADRVARAFTGGVEGWLAVATLVGCLVGVWWWSFIDVGRSQEGTTREGSVGGIALPGEGWSAFRERPMALMGLGILVALYLALLLTPFLAPFGPHFRTAYQPGGEMVGILSPPSLVHPLGTDVYSQDVLSRILYGARISLTVGLVAVGISVTLGTAVGAVSGYWGGWMDSILMRLVDLIMAFPRLVLLIAIVALFPANFVVVVVALAFTQWPFSAVFS